MAALTLLTACEGPTGPPGDQGPQGVEGPEGPQGEPGSVNAFYSAWIPFQVDQWNQVTEFGKITQLYDIAEELVTQDIMDQGAVLVYVRFGGAPPPRPLPFIGYITTTTTEQHLWFRLTSERITVVFSNLGNDNDPGRIGSGNSYRYVIIPGGTPIASYIAGDPSSMSYEELSRRLRIPPD